MELKELLARMAIYKGIISAFVEADANVVIKRQGALELEYILTQAMDKLKEAADKEDDLK